MTIILVGMNHRTAPVELREKLTLPEATLRSMFAHLSLAADGTSSTLGEWVLLSTCNRLEMYACVDDPDLAAADILRVMSMLHGSPNVDLTPHVYIEHEDNAVHHLMSVTCGLDSMILGETQILGQVTRAFEHARSAGLTGPVLSHLFAQAIHAGKRARSESEISRLTTSVSHAAARLIDGSVSHPRDARILIVGAGEMASLAAQALHHVGPRALTFINRTYARAVDLAADFSAQAVPWDQLESMLGSVDAVLSATGAPHVVIDRRMLERAVTQRHGRPLVIVDIAVPRDVDPSVRDLAGVYYHDIDDLRNVVDGNLEMRRAAVPLVETIIEQEMLRFAEWYRSRLVTPVIRTLREWAQSIAEDETDLALNRLSDADERTRQVVSQLAHRLVNRILHQPTSTLRAQATEGNGHEYAHAVRELFALDSEVELDANPEQRAS